jgi:hypothetical protein
MIQMMTALGRNSAVILLVFSFQIGLDPRSHLVDPPLRDEFSQVLLACIIFDALYGNQLFTV